MVVDGHGNSLYLELTQPFKGNPNISIQPVMDKQGILLTGTPEAVQAAKEHIGRALEKQLSVDKYAPSGCTHALYYPHSTLGGYKSPICTTAWGQSMTVTHMHVQLVICIL